MKKFLISLVLLSSLTAYSKSALDFDFGDPKKIYDSVTLEDFKKYGESALSIKNYEYHKKWKNKWEKMCGWWTDGSTVVVNIEKNNNVYGYMLYKNKYYAEMNRSKIILNKKEEELERYRVALKKINRTLDEHIKYLERTDEENKKKYNILMSNETIYTYEKPISLISDEEGDLWQDFAFVWGKTPKDLEHKGHVLYLSPFTLTTKGELFLKPLDKEPITLQQFTNIFGKISDYQYKNHPTDRKVKGYVDYEFLANPLRKMTNEEIKNFKNKKIKHEKHTDHGLDPFYFDGSTKSIIRFDYVD
ncbi:hypothetical protein [uncultured Sneathia sp.]|uniref:hypothetical protein n=1 Tax=uncultured Sneathia sp. TaxID=278067 RepID=UPI002597F20A|nr:hypothetical protein [uncultured Sneathia sp.]